MNVELNDVEVYMIIRCLKDIRKVLDMRPPLPALASKEANLEVRSKEIQSIVYKLENYFILNHMNNRFNRILLLQQIRRRNIIK